MGSVLLSLYKFGNDTFSGQGRIPAIPRRHQVVRNERVLILILEFDNIELEIPRLCREFPRSGFGS